MSKGTVNKVIIIGRTGTDPQIKHTTNGSMIVNISVATVSFYKDKQTNQLVESTEWHRVVLFNKLAEVAGKYLKKGKTVYIEGRIRTTKWQDHQGQDRYTTEIIANEMQFIGGKQENNNEGVVVHPDTQQKPHQQVPVPDLGADLKDDDIPF